MRQRCQYGRWMTRTLDALHRPRAFVRIVFVHRYTPTQPPPAIFLLNGKSASPTPYPRHSSPTLPSAFPSRPLPNPVPMEMVSPVCPPGTGSVRLQIARTGKSVRDSNRLHQIDVMTVQSTIIQEVRVSKTRTGKRVEGCIDRCGLDEHYNVGRTFRPYDLVRVVGPWLVGGTTIG